MPPSLPKLFTSNRSIISRRDSESTRSSRPPSFASNVTTPTYTSRPTSAYDHNDGLSTSSMSMRSPSVLYSTIPDTMFETSAPSSTDTTSEVGSVMQRPPGPRYIYYRIYAQDGAIPSANPVYSDDPYLGRIQANLVTPPHTAKNIRNCLSCFENIDVRVTSSLFPSTSSQNPAGDKGCLSILAYPGPGCTSADPMALVAKISASRRPLDLGLGLRNGATQGPTPFEARYVYYRVYAEDGAIPLKNPTYSDDPYLGCMSAHLVAPPHTAVNLKNCLSRFANIDEAVPTSLFLSASSRFPMVNKGHLSLLAYPGPGCASSEPMALIAKFPAGKRPPVTVVPETTPQDRTPPEICYIYYRVYKGHGAVPLKQPADSDNDPYTGRIRREIVTPPHTAESIIRCISKVEKIAFSHQLQLFKSCASEAPIGGGYISILTSDHPGSTPEDPMALTEASHPPSEFTTRLYMADALTQCFLR